MKTLNKIIELSFYSLFFFVPLIFFGNTSELFEFNKMWLAFDLTIVIVTTWIIKMILQRRISVQKTPLDIPILLFLASQCISSIFSLDPHVSWWGYYSRFNGGLFSTISYVLLYYAFVSNLRMKSVLRILSISLASGIIVALWAFPGHFGYDPTCFLFRGTLDTSCWTDAFKPTIRTFSTLGQP
jgi:putative inorganic carbon (HCO3(-)) transporter